MWVRYPARKWNLLYRFILIGICPFIFFSACSSPDGGTASTAAELQEVPTLTATPTPVDPPSPAAPALTPSPVPSATIPRPSPTTSGPPTESPTPDDGLLKFPANLCCRGAPVEAGRYRIPDWLNLPLTLEVGQGWREINEEAALLFTLVKGRNSIGFPSQLIVFLVVPDDTSPEDLLRPVGKAAELTALTEMTPVQVAEFSGLQLEAVAKPNPGYEGDLQEDIPPGVQILPAINRFFTPGFLWTTSSPEARLRLIAVQAGGRPLLIYLEAPQEEFDKFAEEADPILQSLMLAGE